MGSALINYLRDLWLFSIRRADDLKVSDRLVAKLSVPECTKQFMFAFPQPENDSIVYVLCAQNLSERSARDVEHLIREVHPDAVVALVGNGTLRDIHEYELVEGMGDLVPTSAYRVLMRSFVEKANKEKYDELAGNLVLKEIFGVGFFGHFLAAKRLAEEVGCSFTVIESPCSKSAGVGTDTSSEIVKSSDTLLSLGLQSASLVPNNLGPVACQTRRFFVSNDLQLQMVKLLCPSLALSIKKMSPSSASIDTETDLLEARCNYHPPGFAQTVYLLLLDLHDIFSDIPSISRALAYAQKMLLDVGRGNSVDTNILSEVYTFQIAVEGLRVALNNAGRLPLCKSDKSYNFQELSIEEQSHCLLGKALQSQARKHNTVVAVMDADALTGLRKFWSTPIPGEVKGVVEELVVFEGFGSENTNDGERKRLLSAKPVVAVGAGATAVLGVSSLSKVLPVSTVAKVVMLNIPTSLKLFLIQTHKVTAFVFTKIIGPSKVVAPGFASSGVKASSIFKAAASTGKIRVVTHSVIASAEKTSFSAMRTAFYEIMRKRRVQPIGFMPWATFGFSIATCGGLLAFGDGIECAAESLPAAPSIACLGRGIHNLQQTSQAVRHSCGHKIQTAIESLMYRLKK